MKLIKTTVEGFDEPQFGLRTNYNERHAAQNNWFFWRAELKLWIAPSPRLAARFISCAESEEIIEELGDYALDLAFTWNRLWREGPLFVFEGERLLARRVADAGFEFNHKLKRFETVFVKNALKIRDYAISESFLRELHDISQQNNLVIAKSRAAEANADLPAPSGCEYLPYQKAGILFAAERENTLIADEPGLGKAQSLESKLPTPTGWKLMGQIQVGDMVIGSQGLPVEVTGVYPQGKKDIYRVIFNDGSETECCLDHLWNVTTSTRRWRNQEALIFTLGEILKRGIKDRGGKKNIWNIPIIKPVAFERQHHYLDAYLLGLLLGDGGLCYQVCFSTGDAELIDAFNKLLPSGYIIKHKGRYDYLIIKSDQSNKFALNEIKQFIKKLGLNIPSYEKFIPHNYLFADVEQRISILQGLLDTDGYCASDSTVQFSSSSKQLCEDVRTLVQSLGGVARRSVKKTTHRDSYQLTIALPNEILPFRLVRKLDRYKPRTKYIPQRAIKTVKYVGKKQAQCISVSAPDSLYATDDFILTHNTIQALGVVNMKSDSVKRIVILCPANLKINWSREARKWLIENYSIGIAQGDYLPDTNIIIINFDIIARHVNQIKKLNPDVYIVDEAHYLKNPEAKRSKAALDIEAKCKLFLTGTPILNRPIELYPLLSALDPGRWDNFWRFAKRYTNAKPNGFGHDFSGASNLGELQEILRSTVMIRRLKKDVLKELPPKRRQVIELDNKKVLNLIKEERRQASLFREMQREMFVSETITRTLESPGEFKERINRLHGEKSSSLREYSRTRHRLALAKAHDSVEFIKMYLDADANYKLIVFCHHIEPVEIIYRAFEDRAVFLVGDMSLEEKQQSVDDFQQRADIQLFVGTMGACREGHTLTAASHIIFVEPDPTPGKMTQAEDRAHRIGQKNKDSLLIQHLVYNGSLDVSVIRTAVKKQEIADQTLDIEPEESSELLPPADIDEAAVRLFEKAAGNDFDSEIEFKKSRADSVAWQIKNADYEQFDSSSIDQTEIEICHQNMRLLAAVCDGGDEFDGRGFNKYDAIVGHYLAKLQKLNRRQLYLAKKLSYKYRRQLAEIKLNPKE